VHYINDIGEQCTVRSSSIRLFQRAQRMRHWMTLWIKCNRNCEENSESLLTLLFNLCRWQCILHRDMWNQGCTSTQPLEGLYFSLSTRIGRVVSCPGNGDFVVALALSSHSSHAEAGKGYSLGWVDHGYDFHAGKNRTEEPLVCLCFYKGHLRHLDYL
jgi:hypothetical protein